MTALAHIQERKGARIYDMLLLAGPVILLMAQFGNTSIELLRWLYLLVIGALSAYLIKDQKLGQNPVAIGIGLLAIYTMTTSFLSYYPSVSFLKSISLLLLAGFLLVVPPALQLLQPGIGAKEQMLRLYMVLAVVVVISNTVYYFLMPGSSNSFYSGSSFLAGRFRGWFINPNGVGLIYGVFFLPILWSEFSRHGRGLAKMSILLTFLLAVIQLLASQSRAGIGAGGISLLVLILGRRQWTSRILIATMIGLVVLALLIGNPEDSILRQVVYRNETELQGSGRFPVWIATWNRFLDRMFLGSGLGVANTDIDPAGLTLSTGAYTIEKGNSYLGALEELGLVGTALMAVALLIPLLRACWRGVFTLPKPGHLPEVVLAAIVAAGLANAMLEAWLLSAGGFPGFSFWLFGSLLLYKGEDH